MRRKRRSESKLTYIWSSLRKIYLCNVLVHRKHGGRRRNGKTNADFVVMEEQTTPPLVFRRSAGGTRKHLHVAPKLQSAATLVDRPQYRMSQKCQRSPAMLHLPQNPRQVIQVFSLSQFGPAHTGATTLENKMLSSQTLIVQIHQISSCPFISAS